MEKMTPQEQISDLRRTVARLNGQLQDARQALEGWRKTLEMAAQRCKEAESLLWPNRFTNAKVNGHFKKWHDVDGNGAHWGDVSGRPERIHS